MEISLNKIGKRYLSDWVFRNLTFHFKMPAIYAVSGANGSGKSTLLNILSGHLTPTRGVIEYQLEGQKIETDQIYKHLSFAAPYIDLIEELTLLETIRFHQQFKSFRVNLNRFDFIKLIELEHAKNKEVRFFSSGMKQRLKLGLALCSDTPLVLLDEPTVTLDVQGIQWYQQLLEKFSNDRLIIIASNEERDLISCKEERINILDYKK